MYRVCNLGVMLKMLVAVTAALYLSACDNSPRGEDGVDEGRHVDLPTGSEYILPYAIFFNKHGAADPESIFGKNRKVVIRDVGPGDFPIEGKIKRVETVTLVTYEASCDVLVKTSKGYKIIVIEDDNICNAIYP